MLNYIVALRRRDGHSLLGQSMAVHPERVRLERDECNSSRALASSEMDTGSSLEMVDAYESGLHSYGLPLRPPVQSAPLRSDKVYPGST